METARFSLKPRARNPLKQEAESEHAEKCARCGVGVPESREGREGGKAGVCVAEGRGPVRPVVVN